MRIKNCFNILKNIEYVSLLVLLVCAFWIRFEGAVHYSYHTDELLHLFIAHGSNFADVFSRGLYETHPPLGHFIRHITFFISDDLVFGRVLLIMCNLATLMVAYLIGKKLSPHSFLGIALAALIAFAKLEVVYSVSIRNYAFFTLFAFVTYYYFLRYEGSKQRRDLFGYIVFSLLACMTHFSGFIFTCVLSSSLTITWLCHKEYRRIIAFAAAHALHLLLLGLWYYCYYVKSDIGGWYQFFLTLKPFVMLRNANVLLGFFSVYGGFYIYSQAFFKHPENAVFLVFLLVVSVFSLFRLWRVNVVVVLSVIVAFLTAIILSQLHLYPMTGNRYGTYLLIFTMLPLGKALDDMLSARFLSRKVVCAALIGGAIVFSGYAVQKNVYFADNGEFPNTNESFAASVDYIRQNTAPEDMILTNKGSWLHLRYLKDRFSSIYAPVGLAAEEFEGRTIYFAESRNFLEHIVQENFYQFLIWMDKKIPETSAVWFMVLGSSDYSIMTVHDCEYVKPHITKEYSDRGVLIFQLDRAFLDANFFPPSQPINACFEHSTVPPMG